MIRRFVLSLIITVLLLVVQSTWLGAIALLSVTPDLSLLFILFIAFKNPSPQGQAVGFVSGLLQDGMSSGPLGLNSFVKAAVACSFNVFAGKFYIDRIFMPFLFGFIATLLKAIYLGGLALLFRGRLPSYDFLSYPLWIEAAYNAVSAPVLFLLLSPLERFVLPKDRHS